jgi:outer membrane cobalamin receptor
VDDSHRLHTLGLELAQELSLAAFAQLVGGANLQVENALSTAIGRKGRVSGGLFLEAPLYLSSRLTLTPMLRYDLYTDFPASLTYKLAAVAALSPALSLKASAARSYRAPTLNDLYWPNDGMVSGNPDLRPESGYNAELGLTALNERLQLNLFAFLRYVQDGIQWAFTTIYQPVNIGEALYPGLEAGLELGLLKGLRLSAGYTFLYSYVLSSGGVDYTLADDIRAGYAPVHSLDAGLVLELGATRLGLNAQYVGQRYSAVEGEFGTRSLDPYLVLNAEVRRVLGDHWVLSLEGKNLLNQVYQSLDGYPMPPLSLWVGAELKL